MKESKQVEETASLEDLGWTPLSAEEPSGGAGMPDFGPPPPPPFVPPPTGLLLHPCRVAEFPSIRFEPAAGGLFNRRYAQLNPHLIRHPLGMGGSCPGGTPNYTHPDLPIRFFLRSSVPGYWMLNHQKAGMHRYYWGRAAEFVSADCPHGLTRPGEFFFCPVESSTVRFHLWFRFGNDVRFFRPGPNVPIDEHGTVIETVAL